MSNISHVLSAIEHGDPAAAGKLLPLVYEELRRLAAQKLAREPSAEILPDGRLVLARRRGRASEGDGRLPRGDR